MEFLRYRARGVASVKAPNASTCAENRGNITTSNATVRQKETPMKNPPPGWPRISTSIYYEDAKRAIDWLVEAFGFEVRLKIEGDNGRIQHSELTFHGGLIMVGDAEQATARNGNP